MRILHVISSIDPRQGGTASAALGMARAQRQAGLDVGFVSTFREGEADHLADDLRRGGSDVHLIGPTVGPLRWHRAIGPTLSRLIVTADVVHVHAVWEEIQHQACRLAAKARVPYVVSPHGMLDPLSLGQKGLKKRLYMRLRLRRDLAGAAAGVFTSETERQAVMSLGLFPSAIAEPLGIDLDAFRLPADTRSFRARHAKAAGKRLVLFMGRLHPIKGLDLLLDAFAEAAVPDAAVVLVGPDSDGYQRQLEDQARRLGIADQVLFTGMLGGDDRLQALSAADLFVLPSHHENFGLSVVEALACGVPAIVSDQVNIHGEIVDAGVGAAVPLDRHRLAAEIVAWLNDQPRRSTAASLCRPFVERHYAWEAIARRWAGHYQRLAATRPRPSQGGGNASTGAARDARPALAMIVNSLPPYRLHVHRRIAAEVPELRLLTAVTHDDRDRWAIAPPPEINATLFGPGESAAQQGRAKFALHEWRKGGRIIRWMREQNVRAVVLLGYNDTARVRILYWCRRNGIPCFISADANVLIDNPQGLKRIAKRLIVTRFVKTATGVLPCGRNGEAFFRRYGARADRVYWYPIDPDYDQIQSLPAEVIEGVRRRFALDSTRRRIVYSGRLIWWKKPDLVVDAFARLAAERPEWDLVVVGDGDLRPELERRIPKELQTRVYWTGHLADQTTISAIYRCCDVLVLPSILEQWAVVVPEGAAAGLALVVTRTVGAAAEFVRDGVNGRMVEPNDLPSLRDALLEATDPQNVDRMKASSLEIVREWRSKADPILGLRKALRHSETLSA